MGFLKKTEFANKILNLNKSNKSNLLKKKYFNKWINKFTGKTENINQKLVDLRDKSSKTHQHLRQSLSQFRKTIKKKVYSVYCSSINSANRKKTNSFLIFITNFKEYLKYNEELLKGCVDFYVNIYDHLDFLTNGKCISTINNG